MLSLHLKWGRSKFEPFAAGSYAKDDGDSTQPMGTADYTAVVYRSAARRRAGIMSGTWPPDVTRPILTPSDAH
jgi:hypothetical protein